MRLCRVITGIALASVILALFGCGGGHAPTLPSPAGRAIVGVLDLGVDEFVVEVDERVVCTGDVIIRAGSARIEGELYSQACGASGRDGFSITIETEGDILVTGTIRAGDGCDGTRENDGGDGGALKLISANGDISIGGAAVCATAVPDRIVGPTQAGGSALHSGDGGDGGAGELDGGHGGTGGHIVLEALAGTITIHQAPALFKLGNGGHGGDAIWITDDLSGVDTSAPLTNGGGVSGFPIFSCDALVGLDLADSGELFEGKPMWTATFDEGMAVGGIGGDGGCAELEALPGATIASASVGGASVAPRAAGTFERNGDDGGDGWTGGGAAEPAQADIHNLTTLEGQAGEEAKATGGDGGGAGFISDDFDATTGTYASVSLNLRGKNLTAGDGGWAFAHASDGGKAGRCLSGKNGGEATAAGGVGGDALVGAGASKPGAGGNARAYGGNGAAAGDCCDPAGKGKGGGNGGDVRGTGGEGGSLRDYSFKPLTISAKGGDVWAKSGNAGPGGDGQPAGGPGSPGSSMATPGDGFPKGKVKQNETGAPAAGGEACPDPDPDPPPTPVPTDITGKITSTGGGGKTMHLDPKAHTGASGRPTGGRTATTTADGSYAFTSVAPGDYLLYPDGDAATPPNYWRPEMREITKVAGVGLSGQDFMRMTGVGSSTVRIPVRDQSGADMAGVLVDLVGFHASRGSHAETSGADGLAVFTDIWRGLYTATPAAAPAGFKWAPATAWVMVEIGYLTTPEFGLVPE